MTFVPVEELSEVFAQALGKRIITPVLLGESEREDDLEGRADPAQRKAHRTEAAARTTPHRRRFQKSLSPKRV